MNLHDLLTNANVSLHLACSGAGASLQHELWKTPGCSAYLSGASFPYSQAETTRFLGFTPEKFCSAETAVNLASEAFMRAYEFGGKSPVGLGVTAAVASARELRGGCRVHMCLITETHSSQFSYELPSHATFPKGAREAHEAMVTGAALGMLRRLNLPEDEGESPLLKERFFARPYFEADGMRRALHEEGQYPTIFDALVPGAFNPPHEGHHWMAESARQRPHAGSGPIAYYVTSAMPHKAPLTTQDLLKRAALLRGHDTLFSQGEALYIEKARRFPGTPFVIGTDALQRMLDPKWGPEVGELLNEFSELGTEFLVASQKELPLVDELALAGMPSGSQFQYMFTELPGSPPKVRSSDLRKAIGQ